MSFQLNLDTETVDHAFPETPICVSGDTSIADALAAMNQQNRGSVLIVEDDKLVGIFTERDAVRLMKENASFDGPISEQMVGDPVTLSKNDTVADAIARMSSGGYRHLPIVDADGQPTGTLSSRGILHYLVEHFPQIVYTLPPEPHHTTQEREGA